MENSIFFYGPLFLQPPGYKEELLWMEFRLSFLAQSLFQIWCLQVSGEPVELTRMT